MMIHALHRFVSSGKIGPQCLALPKKLSPPSKTSFGGAEGGGKDGGENEVEMLYVDW